MCNKMEFVELVATCQFPKRSFGLTPAFYIFEMFSVPFSLSPDDSTNVLHKQ